MLQGRFCIYLIIQLCCILSAGKLKSQQGNIWYFGNFAGLSFNSTPPVSLNDGAMNTQEGTSVICDGNGDLLFYTNGRTVFNRDHDLMLNGDNLKGHPSTFQSCVIIPKPGSVTIFYIFTADAWENDGEGGYCYSEVDMTLDNGRGGVTANKNIYLSGPSSERLTAIRTNDNNSYWVVTNQWSTNIFRAYKVDCNGVNTTPVVSTVGKAMDEDTYCNIGTLRVSPDGNYIVQTNVKGRLQSNPTNEYAQLFDFDDVTGQLSNARLMPLINDGYYFGAEFSTNSKILYMINPFKNAVHQYDISSGDLTTIMASKTVLAVNDGVLNGATIGPDQKIYLSTGSASLHVINNPNVMGPGCNLVLKQQKLSSPSLLSLPNIVPNLYVERPVDFTFQLVGNCTGSVQFNAVAQIPGVVLQWEFGDGNTATGTNPVHTYSDPNDEYLVKLTATNNLNCVYEVVSKRLRPGGEQLTANFGYSVQCDSRIVNLSDSSINGTGQVSYKWSFGDGNTSSQTSPSHQYAAPGLYTIRLILTASSGCVADTLDQTVDLRKPVVNAGSDIQVSTIDPIQLNATGAVTYEWKPGTYLDNPKIANPIMKARDKITYVVTGYNAAGCSDTDTLQITVKEMEIIQVPNAFRPSGITNPVLRPVLRLVKGLNYFQVYNRWGQLVFSTKTIGEGWNGMYKDLPQPSGTYVWVLEVVDSAGNIVRKRGSSILIR